MAEHNISPPHPDFTREHSGFLEPIKRRLETGAPPFCTHSGLQGNHSRLPAVEGFSRDSNPSPFASQPAPYVLQPKLSSGQRQ
jgi:hypothetical protein